METTKEGLEDNIVLILAAQIYDNFNIDSVYQKNLGEGVFNFYCICNVIAKMLTFNFKKNVLSKLLYYCLLFCTPIAIGQTHYFGRVVNKQKDTINVKIDLADAPFLNGKNFHYFQDKLRVIQNTTVKEYLPKDLISFQFRTDKGMLFTFDSVNDLFFAQRLYAGEVKLFKFIKEFYVYPNRNVIRYYLIKKPDDSDIVEVPAMGLSRMITKSTMLQVAKDCPASAQKIEHDEFKVKDEDDLIAFIKDYEKNCFAK